MALPRTLKAGMPVSLSGQFQVQGQQALAGLQAWAGDVNQAGGVLVGRRGTRLPLSVVYYDDSSKPDMARLATEQLITGDRAHLLFGPYSSVLAQAAAEVAEAHGKVLWNQGGASDGIYQRGYRWVVGILTPASEYLAGLPPLVRQADPEAATLGILRPSLGSFAHAVSSGFEQHARALGFRTALVREYHPATTDFTQIVEEVVGIRPSVVVAVGRIHHDLRLARQLARRRPALGAVAVVAAPIQQFRDALGEQVEGFLGPSQWEPPEEDSGNIAGPVYGPTARQVLASLRRRGYSHVDYPMVQGYAAGVVAQRCVEAAGTLEDRALRETAGALDFPTFYGRFKIDPDTGRQIGRSVVIVQWQQGRKVIVWPPEQRQAGLVYPWRQAN